MLVEKSLSLSHPNVAMSPRGATSAAGPQQLHLALGCPAWLGAAPGVG